MDDLIDDEMEETLIETSRPSGTHQAPTLQLILKVTDIYRDYPMFSEIWVSEKSLPNRMAPTSAEHVSNIMHTLRRTADDRFSTYPEEEECVVGSAKDATRTAISEDTVVSKSSPADDQKVSKTSEGHSPGSIHNSESSASEDSLDTDYDAILNSLLITSDDNEDEEVHDCEASDTRDCVKSHEEKNPADLSGNEVPTPAHHLKEPLVESVVAELKPPAEDTGLSQAVDVKTTSLNPDDVVDSPTCKPSQGLSEETTRESNGEISPPDEEEQACEVGSSSSSVGDTENGLVNYDIPYRKHDISNKSSAMKKSKSKTEKKSNKKQVMPIGEYLDCLNAADIPQRDLFYEQVIKDKQARLGNARSDVFDKAADCQLTESTGKTNNVVKEKEVPDVESLPVEDVAEEDAVELTEGCIVMENLPDGVTRKEVEDFVSHNGRILELKLEKDGEFQKAEIVMNFSSDIDWLVECYNDSQPFGGSQVNIKCWRKDNY